MIIRSNPRDGDGIEIESDVTIGDGDITLKITDEQLQLITTYLAFTRLGQGSVYKDAAFELLTSISAELGDLYIEDAMDSVDMTVTIEDEAGVVVASTADPTLSPTLEV